jgi:hypothetical protein
LGWKEDFGIATRQRDFALNFLTSVGPTSFHFDFESNWHSRGHVITRAALPALQVAEHDKSGMNKSRIILQQNFIEEYRAR